MKKFLLNSLFALIAMVGAFSWSVNANAALRGDLTGDGVVNVGDVSSLYEAIVSGNADLKFDVNGDGQVNAGDVSELYDIILHGGGEEFGKVYILGNVAGDWDPTIGQEMTTSDGVTYTAKMEAVNLDGYSYFSFTKMLAETNDQAGWDLIADYRFGAVSEGDFLVTDEQLGQELALTAEGYQTFKIPTGTYNLTVNVEDMTLVIEKEAVVIDKLWMLGDMVEGGWAPNKGNEMTYDAAKGTFSTSFTAEGVQYFSFTSKLAEQEGEEGWAEIAASRFGAVTEDGTDFWVTADQLDKELALQAGSTAFRVEAGSYTVTVDLAKMNVVISGEIAPEPIADVWVLGDFVEGGWAPNKGLKMTYDEAKKVYTANLAVDDVKYFSFTTALAENAEDWDAIADKRLGAVTEDGSDFWVTAEQLDKELAVQAGQVPFRVAAGEYVLSLDLEKKALVITGEIAPEPIADLYLISDAGNGWDLTKGVKLTYDEAKAVYTGELKAEGDVYFSFTKKLATAADGWDEIAADRLTPVADGENYWVTAETLGTETALENGSKAFYAKAGEYTITVDLAKNVAVIDGEIAPEPIADVWVLGDFLEGGWAANNGLKMTYDETKKVYTAALAVDDVKYFNFTTALAETADGWDAIAANRIGAVADEGTDFWVTAEQLGQEITVQAGDKAFRVAAGEYNLSLDLEKNVLVITGEIAPEPIADLYLISDAGQGWDLTKGVKLTYDEAKAVYTGELKAEGDVYFSFTKKLATAADGWEEIAADRVTPVSDGDFWVTAETLGTETALENGSKAFYAKAGEYTITVDLAKNVAVIDGEIAPEPIADLYLFDNIAGNWDLTKGTKLTYNETTKKYTGAIESESEFYFVFGKKQATAADGWSEIGRIGAQADGDFWITAETLDNEITLVEGAENTFKAPAGSYTVTVDLANMKAVVTGEIAPEPIADLYLISDAGQGWDLTKGVKLTYDEAKAVYTGELKAEGDVYFSFTKKLATAANGWDEIAADRLTPVADGENYWVTAETLGTETALENGSKAFYAKAGEYTITVDLEKNVAVIDGEIVQPKVETSYVVRMAPAGDWDKVEDLALVEADGAFTVKNVEVAAKSEFKVVKIVTTEGVEEPAVTWYGPQGSDGNFWITAETLETAIQLSDADGLPNLYFDNAGTFSFSFDPEAVKLTVTGEFDLPEVTTAYAVRMAPAGDWNNVEDLALVEANGVYAVNNIEVAAKSEFKVVKIVTTEGVEEPAVTWYGPEGSDGNYWITSETLDNAIQLSDADGLPNLYFDNAGTFGFSFDPEAVKLTVSGEFEEVPVTNGYYLTGTPNNWSETDKTYAFTQSATNENEWTLTLNSLSGDQWFKIAPEAAYGNDFWNNLIGASVNGNFDLSGTYVVGADAQAWCLPGNWNATTLTITINTEDKTWKFVTDGSEPVVSTDYDYLYVAGSNNGWQGSADGDKIASVKGEDNYSGVFNPGTEFKFQKSAGSWATNWGGSNGKLVSNGANITANGTISYVTASINNLTYSVTPITRIGVIGDATAGGWDSDQALTYNSTTGAWEGTLTLTAGSIKFRANNDWAINWGGKLNNLVEGGDNITVEAGTYKVSLKLVCKGEYVATLTRQ